MMNASSVTDTAWQKHRRWSVAADSIKRSIGIWRTVVLILGIFGAFLETLSTQVPAGMAQQICAWVGAACLGVIPVLVHRLLPLEKTRAWVRARSASEGLKSEVYAFSARAAPYDGNPDDAKKALEDRAEEVEESVKDLLRYLARDVAPGDKPPVILTPEDYIEQRVQEQIRGFYRPKARTYARKAGFLRSVEICLAVVAAVLAAASGVWGDTVEIGVWVAVVTTIAGAIAAHITASRYDYLVTSYLATARRLEDLGMRWAGSGKKETPSPEWSELVRQCEEAISVENQSWMAKWAPAPS
jgi:hypothetical protein